MTLLFVPVHQGPNDLVGVYEALGIIAGRKYSSHLDEDADEERVNVAAFNETIDLDMANDRLVRWLVTGAIDSFARDGKDEWRLIDRRWYLELLTRPGCATRSLPEKLGETGELGMEGAMIFLNRSALIAKRDGFSGLSGDDLLVAQMRKAVANGQQKNLHQASFAMAKTVQSNSSIESVAQRLRKREKATRSAS